MRDFFPEEAQRLRALEETFLRVAGRYGYREMRFPLLEEAGLFEKGTGETTDIVQKEMYTLMDRGGRKLALRPEGTPSVVRALMENRVIKQEPFWKVAYVGPMFRYERPQKGRYRQFHQAGVEFIGVADPEADVEVILLLLAYLRQIGIQQYQVRLNNLGCMKDRESYRGVLEEFLRRNAEKLAELDRERLQRNPFRVLDSKEEKTRRFLREARVPPMEEHLCSDCRIHGARVQELLKDFAISMEWDPQLVRGLDYYERTVFEVISPELGAQDALGGGGRYDHLFSSLGYAEDFPAVGFAVGLERLLLVQTQSLQEEGLVAVVPAQAAMRTPALRVAECLREKGFKAEIAWKAGRLRSGLKWADKRRARWAIIVGDEEWRRGAVILRNMETGEQKEIPWKEAPERL